MSCFFFSQQTFLKKRGNVTSRSTIFCERARVALVPRNRSRNHQNPAHHVWNLQKQIRGPASSSYRLPVFSPDSSLNLARSNESTHFRSPFPPPQICRGHAQPNSSRSERRRQWRGCRCGAATAARSCGAWRRRRRTPRPPTTPTSSSPPRPSSTSSAPTAASHAAPRP